MKSLLLPTPPYFMGKEATRRVEGLACGHSARERQRWGRSLECCSPGAACTAPSSPLLLISAPSSLPAPSQPSNVSQALSILDPHAHNLHKPKVPEGLREQNRRSREPCCPVGRLTTPLDHMRTLRPRARQDAGFRLPVSCRTP